MQVKHVTHIRDQLLEEESIKENVDMTDMTYCKRVYVLWWKIIFNQIYK
jgi:hypothetical protein